MTWAYIINSSDRRWFKRCRRAWDMGARARQNYKPIKLMQVFDFDRAIRDALAVYYFPGIGGTTWSVDRGAMPPYFGPRS
jgi:hypothetical protein